MKNMNYMKLWKLHFLKYFWWHVSFFWVWFNLLIRSSNGSIRLYSMWPVCDGFPIFYLRSSWWSVLQLNLSDLITSLQWLVGVKSSIERSADKRSQPVDHTLSSRHNLTMTFLKTFSLNLVIIFTTSNWKSGIGDESRKIQKNGRML